jgi:hypothetical protein
MFAGGRKEYMNIDVVLPQDRKSQINIELALRQMCGMERPSLCDVCGGIMDDETAESRRCLCDKQT